MHVYLDARRARVSISSAAPHPRARLEGAEDKERILLLRYTTVSAGCGICRCADNINADALRPTLMPQHWRKQRGARRPWQKPHRHVARVYIGCNCWLPTPLSLQQVAYSDQDIVEIMLFPVVNEGTRVMVGTTYDCCRLRSQ